MSTRHLDESHYCRLSRAMLEKHGGTYDEAMSRLERLQLHIRCGAEVAASPALQAAVLTAVNTGKRAFLGGVSIEMPVGIPLCVPWPERTSLAKAVVKLGAQVRPFGKNEHTQLLCIGTGDHAEADALRVWVAGWRGGVAPAGSVTVPTGRQDMTLAGIMGAALSVARGFLQTSGLTTHFVERPVGFSLWRPDLDANDSTSDGPSLEFLPRRLWFAGLGHLGQGYLWNLGLLPYDQPSAAHFTLQDFDRMIPGNFGSGLLCEADSSGLLKTRLASNWLEARGFHTTLVERAFDDTLRLRDDEPRVLLCGFDNAEVRALLDTAPFNLVIDCGLGDSLDTFDRVLLHTFPDAGKRPSEIWVKETDDVKNADSRLIAAFDQGLPCGVLATTLARKALATSFVGAFAGSLALGEVLRGLHGGIRCEIINVQMRGNSVPRVFPLNENYQLRAVHAGCLLARQM